MIRLAYQGANKVNTAVFREFRNRSDVYLGVNPIGEYRHNKEKVITEFEHISSAAEKDWLKSEYEKVMSTPLSLANKLNSYRMIQMAETFENFFHKKYNNYKRFSGEGTESLVPCLYSIIQQYYKNASSSIILTIGHRGKLSVLVGLMNYPLRNLFYKIRGTSLVPEELNKSEYYFCDEDEIGIAVTSERPEFKGMKISMVHNPSHLEIGGAVAMGKTRSKQDNGREAMHVCVHGDAAISGQGVVYELTQMAHLENFSVGGTVHIVTNNQLGFTTPESHGRSSAYCTDVLKIIEAPIVHVNAHSVEDVVKLGNLAVKYRDKFNNDFAIDLVGFRKYGHNEVDDPTITNPLMYKIIKETTGSATQYAQKLVDEGTVTKEYVEKLKISLETHLNKEFSLSDKSNLDKNPDGSIKYDSFKDQWLGFSPLHDKKSVKTSYPKDNLEEIIRISASCPEGFKLHPILQRNLQGRLENLANGKVDWTMAEIMAFGSLLQEGYNVRLSGEDIVRGTFTQRNIGFTDQNTEKKYFPLSRITPGKLSAVNSLLSELGVVGFEYGYSLDDPKNLVLWEAQFGDFSNMAQPIIDTYIVSGEAKWVRQSGLVLLLPHGQESQGPDHSSGMLERFLTQVNDPLASQINIQVANLVHPSNYFHLLRSLMLRKFRRPLILGSPKSGLRHKFAVSSIEEFTGDNEFQPVIIKNHGKGSEVLFGCNGKVYLDLLTRFNDISLMLVEELSPFPYEKIEKIAKSEGKEFVWVQEEPKNLGVYNYVRPFLKKIFGDFKLISRPAISASSVGNSADYKTQQENIFSEIDSIKG